MSSSNLGYVFQDTAVTKKLISQIDIASFRFTFGLTGVYFRSELNYVGQVGQQKIIFEPIRAQKSLISICGFNYMYLSVSVCNFLSFFCCMNLFPKTFPKS